MKKRREKEVIKNREKRWTRERDEEKRNSWMAVKNEEERDIRAKQTKREQGRDKRNEQKGEAQSETDPHKLTSAGRQRWADCHPTRPVRSTLGDRRGSVPKSGCDAPPLLSASLAESGSSVAPAGR